MTESLTLEHVHKDVMELRKELDLIRSLLEEELELSDETKKLLKEARKANKKNL
ncbi:MAG: hypothetical protein HZB65_03770 [Candidatus Aenigmarchaeota archaeon]|nr:hypothetical protein [Candidatus Aenigmarchaeota archaeon]